MGKLVHCRHRQEQGHTGFRSRYRGIKCWDFGDVGGRLQGDWILGPDEGATRFYSLPPLATLTLTLTLPEKKPTHQPLKKKSIKKSSPHPFLLPKKFPEKFGVDSPTPSA